jgi:hypothetical protein
MKSLYQTGQTAKLDGRLRNCLHREIDAKNESMCECVSAPRVSASHFGRSECEHTMRARGLHASVCEDCGAFM